MTKKQIILSNLDVFSSAIVAEMYKDAGTIEQEYIVNEAFKKIAEIVNEVVYDK